MILVKTVYNLQTRSRHRTEKGELTALILAGPPCLRQRPFPSTRPADRQESSRSSEPQGLRLFSCLQHNPGALITAKELLSPGQLKRKGFIKIKAWSIPCKP